MKKYLIVTTQRTGSTWLIDMLHNSGNIASYSEMFILTPNKDYPSYGCTNIKLFEKWVKIKKYSNFFKRKTSLYDGYFAEIEKAALLNENIEAFGLKVMYQQIAANKGFMNFALTYFDRIIHLKRKNHLDIAVSKIYMELYEITHNPTNERPIIEIDIRETINYIKKLIVEESKVSDILMKQEKGKVNTYFYEDLIADNEKTMNDIYNHIGVRPSAVETTFEKGNKKKLVDIISNYDALVTELTKQDMQHYLDI